MGDIKGRHCCYIEKLFSAGVWFILIYPVISSSFCYYNWWSGRVHFVLQLDISAVSSFVVSPNWVFRGFTGKKFRCYSEINSFCDLNVATLHIVMKKEFRCPEIFPQEELLLIDQKVVLSINLFHVTIFFVHTLKISENFCFSDIFRGYWKRPMTRNGLIRKVYQKKHTSHCWNIRNL